MHAPHTWAPPRARLADGPRRVRPTDALAFAARPRAGRPRGLPPRHPAGLGRVLASVVLGRHPRKPERVRAWRALGGVTTPSAARRVRGRASRPPARARVPRRRVGGGPREGRANPSRAFARAPPRARPPPSEPSSIRAPRLPPPPPPPLLRDRRPRAAAPPAPTAVGPAPRSPSSRARRRIPSRTRVLTPPRPPTPRGCAR